VSNSVDFEIAVASVLGPVAVYWWSLRGPWSRPGNSMEILPSILQPFV
jgi:hypothetical protein